MATESQTELGRRIREERTRAGIPQESLAAEVGLERTVINKIETGNRKLTALELADIARVLNVQMSSFFVERVPALVAHRSHQGLDTRDSRIDELLARIAEDVELLHALGARDLGLEGAQTVADSKFTAPETNAEVEKLAIRARNLLQISPSEPVVDLAAVIGRVGLLAFSADIGSDSADAGTIALRVGSVSLVNSHLHVGRRRLAIAHEVGHHLLSHEYTVDWRIDDYANDSIPAESRLDRFARALLLPQKATPKAWKAYLENHGERGAAVRLASEFRVDMATLARRLMDLGAIDSERAAAIRNIRTNQADIVEGNLLVPLEEFDGVTVPRPYALAVLGLVSDESISRERGLALLRGTFEEGDLPAARHRRADEIWNYAS